MREEDRTPGRLETAEAPYAGISSMVMMSWEQGYMRELVKALGVRGDDDVLEIGWGLGFSATAIQEGYPRSHTIIECDEEVAERARDWAKGRPGVVEIIEGFWQTVLPTLQRTFSAIFFDDFPLPVEREDQQPILAVTGSRWYTFLDVVLSHHSRVGTRVSGYLAEELDLSRPDCAYQRYPFPVEVPADCPYMAAGEQVLYVPLLVLREPPRVCAAILSGGWRGSGGAPVSDGDSTIVLAGGWSRKKARRAKLQEEVLRRLGCG